MYMRIKEKNVKNYVYNAFKMRMGFDSVLNLLVLTIEYK